MSWFNISFERMLLSTVCLIGSIPVILLGLLKQHSAVPFSLPITALSIVIWCASLFFAYQTLLSRYKLIMSRAQRQTQSLLSQDYGLLIKSPCQVGESAQLQSALKLLSEQLQEQKEQVDEQAFVLYRLIQQLNTPILVFDHRQQLSQGNGACTQLLGQPWQTLRFSSSKRLGFQATPDWQFIDPYKRKRWQVRHSVFLDRGKQYQLLVCIDIQSALREREIKAWQQMTRVLNHEIKNSLTPISALAQSLSQMLEQPRQVEAMEIIMERAKHLQHFVSQFAKLNQPIKVRPREVVAKTLFQALCHLYPGQKLTAQGLELVLEVDETLLQQVLINLIKNAIEAESINIQLSFKIDGPTLHIQLRDDGHGILNPDNLFVPFYTTKPNGQGIGLSLCQHLIEQMGGELSLKNNTTTGACAHITLPASIRYQ